MYPDSVAFRHYKIRPRSEHYEPAIYLERKRETIKLGTALWCYPTYEAEHRGVWLAWEGGRWFFPSKLFTLPPRQFSSILLAQGYVFNPAYGKAIRDYATQCFGENTAVTPKGVEWPDKAIWEMENEEASA